MTRTMRQMSKSLSWVGFSSVYRSANPILCYSQQMDTKKFMAYYRKEFPHATVLPKMDMLEEHVVPWLRQWHVGFGLLGEQGMESIHKHFNQLTRTYNSVPEQVDQLRTLMREHLLHIAPEHVAATPEVREDSPQLKNKELDSVIYLYYTLVNLPCFDTFIFSLSKSRHHIWTSHVTPLSTTAQLSSIQLVDAPHFLANSSPPW